MVSQDKNQEKSTFVYIAFLYPPENVSPRNASVPTNSYNLPFMLC